MPTQSEGAQALEDEARRRAYEGTEEPLTRAVHDHITAQGTSNDAQAA